jgi:hypothetical protein
VYGVKLLNRLDKKRLVVPLYLATYLNVHTLLFQVLFLKVYLNRVDILSAILRPL